MHIEQLTTQVSVSDQITIEDVVSLANKGIEVLVCNRPDGEDFDQTPYADIEQAAKATGLEFRLLDFSSYRITSPNRDRFIEIIRERKRVHAVVQVRALKDCGGKQTRLLVVKSNTTTLIKAKRVSLE